MHSHELTCTIIFCFGKTKYFLGSDRSKDHSKTKYFFGVCFGFAKATNNCAGQLVRVEEDISRGGDYVKVRGISHKESKGAFTRHWSSL